MSPLPLTDLQRAFRDHILARDAEVLIAASVGDRIPAAARLRVYRHHVFTSLGAALGATFSTVRGVVGDDFFGGMARAFVAHTPPAGPVLSEYGETFPAFVAAWPAAGDLPYLADVARLDWALNVAYTAPDQAALTAEALAALPPEALGDLRPELRAGVSILRSRYPIDRIWSLNHGDGEASVNLDEGGVALLVFPRADDAAFVRLDDEAAALVETLAAGDSLGAAVDRMVAMAASDVGPVLGRVLAWQALAAIGPADRNEA
jgi:hypothetical protein